jgi:AGZA family xanthine/uracil permease-like MFS transporter
MLKKIFGFDPNVTSIRIEIIAGITTFLTMAYILAVNPGIFSALADQGMPTNAVFTATALAAIVGTLIMAVWAKKPFGLAPGMGLNAFFVYTVCLGMGYSWQFALTAILIEGIIFILLSICKVRELIVDSIPTSMKAAISVGIGLYIAFIGLKSAGIIVHSDATFVTLFDLTDRSGLLALIGIFITGLLVVLNVKGGILWGILVTTLIGIPMGVTQFNGVASVPPSIEPIFFQFEFHNIFTWDMLIVVFTFLFIDMFDTIGTVVGVSMKAGMVDENGKIDKIGRILMADAVATTVGSCLGASTTTTYIESAAGVGEGGRSGLTALVIACCFALALFLSPLFLAIPAAATGPALVIVGVMMCSSITKIGWNDYSEAIPAFLTMLLMPLCYSISEGIMIGVIVYVILNGCSGHGRAKKISVTMWVLAILFVIRYLVNALRAAGLL